jgi:hypothetical protein
MLLKLKTSFIYQSVSDKIAKIFKIPIYFSISDFENVYHSFPRPHYNFKFFNQNAVFVKLKEITIEKDNMYNQKTEIILYNILSSEDGCFWVEKRFFEEV